MYCDRSANYQKAIKPYQHILNKLAVGMAFFCFLGDHLKI
jgi:hypothetical protein